MLKDKQSDEPMGDDSTTDIIPQRHSIPKIKHRYRLSGGSWGRLLPFLSEPDVPMD